MSVRKHSEVSVIFLASVGLAACGGGSGGDDGDSSGLSTSEQAAVAAQSATGTVSAAQSFTSDPTSGGMGGNTSSTTKRITQDRSSLNCGNGNVGFTNDKPGFDINAQSFPEPPFTTATITSGNDANRKLRADECVTTTSTSTLEIDGASDTIAREDIGTTGREAQVQRLGGYQGENSEPDINSTFDFKQTQDGVTTLDFSARGEIFTCDGCKDGNLGDFVGNPGRDQTVAMFLEAKIGDDSDTYRFTFGDSLNDRLKFESSVVSSGSPSVTAVELNGGIEFSASGGCDFSADYNTVTALQIENFQTSNSKITDGEIEVAVNGNSPNTVTFDSDGNVMVDGEPVDTSSIDADCNTFNDVGS